MKSQSTTTLSAVFFATAAPSHAATIANWKVLSAASPLTVGGVPTSGLSTNSPVVGSTSPTEQMDGVGVAGRFGTTSSPESVTLAVGETLTVSATITLRGGLSNISNHYRFAVLNDGGQFAAGSALSWAGGWNHAVSGTAGTGASLYQANTSTGLNFMSTSSNAVDLAPTVGRSGTFNGNTTTAYTWTMSITRDSATTVDLVSSFIGGSGTFSETYTEDNATTSWFTYTSIGILTSAATDLDRLNISGAQYSVIPEPSTALLGGLALLVLLRRRRH